MGAIRHTTLTVLAASTLLGGCGLDKLIEQASDLLSDPEIMAAFSAATVQDALEQLDLAQLGGDPFSLIQQESIGLDVRQAQEPGATPAFAPLALQACDISGDPDLPDIPPADQDNLCAISAPSGQWQLDMVWYYHVDWAQYGQAITDFYAGRPKLDPSNDGTVYADENADMYPAISIVDLSGTISRPALGISATLAVNNLTYSDYTAALGYADVFTNDTEVVKTVEFSHEDSKITQLVESFRGNMGGAPDGDSNLTGVNGVVDVTDTAWYFSQYAEGRRGAQLYREVSAAAGGNLLMLGRVPGAVVPGSYAEIVTPVEGDHVRRIARVAQLQDANTLTLTEVVTFANDATTYRVVSFTASTVTVTGQFPTPHGLGAYNATLSRLDGSFSSTRSFPESAQVSSITETGSVTASGSEFTRTIILADGTEITESVAVSLTRNAEGAVASAQVTYDRADEGTVTVSAERGEFGFVSLTIDAMGGDNVHVQIEGTLDKSGAGELTVAIDRPDISPEYDITGTLQRTADGRVQGTLTVTDQDGESAEVAVDAEAEAFNRLLARARADARGTARAGTATE